MTGLLQNKESVDSAVEFISNILVETASLAGMLRKKGAVPQKSTNLYSDSCIRKVKHYEWYDKECSNLQQQLRLTSKLLSSDHNIAWLRERLVTENKQYKKILRKNKSIICKIFSISIIMFLKNIWNW